MIMSLEENLKKKRFIVTSEIQPPIGTGVQELIRNVERIRGRVDALTVPELKIEGVVTDTMGTCRALRDQKFEPILQTTCREKSRIDIQEHLMRASESGIENILAFTEDYRITGDSLQEIMFFHVDSGKLFSVMESLHQGYDISGKEIPVVAEVILVRSAEMGLFLNKHVKPGMVPNHIIEKLAKAADKEKASIEIVSDLVKGLKDICQGVHFIPIGAEDRLSKYLDAAKLSSL